MSFKIWFERSEVSSPTLFNKVKQLKGPYSGVHFSKTDFLSLNPNPGHFDPIGIYVFPKDYVLGNGLFKNNMFAGYPYVFLIEPSATAKILNLNMDRNTAEKLLSDMGIDKDLLDSDEVYHKSNMNSPGHLFWGVLEKIRNQKGLPKNSSWNSFFKKTGYNVLYDPGLGIIHSNEPNQIVYLDPKSYRVVDLITNDSGYKILYSIAENFPEYQLFKKKSGSWYSEGKSEITLKDKYSTIELSNSKEYPNTVWCVVYGYENEFKKEFAIKSDDDLVKAIQEIKNFLKTEKKEISPPSNDYSKMENIAITYVLKYDKEYPGRIEKNYKNNTKFIINYMPSTKEIAMRVKKGYAPGSYYSFSYHVDLISSDSTSPEEDVKSLIEKIKNKIKDDIKVFRSSSNPSAQYGAEDALKFVEFLEKRVLVKRSITRPK